MAIDMAIIERLGGLERVAERIGMTANGLYRYTRDAAEVPPARQRQLMALAQELGKRLAWRDFHQRVETPALMKGTPNDTSDTGRRRRQQPARPHDGGGGPVAFVY